MNNSTHNFIEQVRKILVRTDRYLNADDLSKMTHRSKATIYKTIRLMRESGIGVYSVPNKGGYILSEFADKKDDVHFIRMANGRYVSSVVAFNAAKPDIFRRWQGIQRKELLQLITPINMKPEPLLKKQKLLEGV